MPEKEKTLRALKSICWHEIEERGDYGGANCINCSNPQSWDLFEWTWYCPDSPDHQCHYFSEVDENGKRFVMSINGEKILLLNYKTDKNGYVNGGARESKDYCIFCGDPEERK